jgi:hypothetical protein
MASKIKAAIREVEKISAAVGGRDTTPAKWMGKWEAEKSYGTLQKVEHLGNSYVCIKNCAGVDPEADVALGDGVQGVCWLLIARKGDDGEGIESIDEVGGGEEIDGNRVVGRWKDYRITYASGKTLDYRVFGGADGKQGPAGAGITNIFFKEATKEGNVYYIQVGQNIYPFTAPEGPKGDDGVSPAVTVTPIANGHRITITDAAGQKSFDVMDGEDGNGGGGTGDMMTAVYDPQGKATDIFAYVDEKTASAPDATFVGEKSGEIIQIDSLYNAPVQGVSVKDGSAVTSVTVWGKNLMHRDYDRTVNSIGVTAAWDPETQEFVLNGTTTSGGDIKLCDPFDLRWVPGETYTMTVQQTGGTATLGSYSGTTYSWGIFQNNAARFVRGSTANTAFTPTYQFTATAFETDAGKYNILYFQCWAKGTVFNNYRVKIQIEKGSIATEWEPYRGVSAALENVHTLMLEKGLNYIASTPQKEISVRYLVDENEHLKTMQIDAERVEFTDGENLQQKFDGGTLKGKDATINGVNALTIQGGDGIEAAMSGSTLTIKAKTVEEWTFTLEDDSTVTKKVVLV